MHSVDPHENMLAPSIMQSAMTAASWIPSERYIIELRPHYTHHLTIYPPILHRLSPNPIRFFKHHHVLQALPPRPRCLHCPHPRSPIQSHPPGRKTRIQLLVRVHLYRTCLSIIEKPSCRKKKLIFFSRELQLYTSGCDGEYDEHLSGTNDQTFPCTGSVTGWHNAKMDNMAANGLKVLLYADGGCLNQIGEVNRDDTCYAAPKDVRALVEHVFLVSDILTVILVCDLGVRCREGLSGLCKWTIGSVVLEAGPCNRVVSFRFIACLHCCMSLPRS